MKGSLFQRGFTMIEVMVVVTIISILSAVLYASFDTSRAGARDSVRQVDLKQTQLALELYRAQNGRYPARGCGVTSGWAGPGPSSNSIFTECDDYINGLAPRYIAELPTDPISEDVSNRGFYYRTDAGGTMYKLMVFRTVERREVEDYNNEFARCPSDYGSGDCGTSPQSDVYAVYSAGAEDW